MREQARCNTGANVELMGEGGRGGRNHWESTGRDLQRDGGGRGRGGVSVSVVYSRSIGFTEGMFIILTMILFWQCNVGLTGG